MPQPSDPLPRWFRLLRGVLIGAYGLVAVACGAAGFLMMVIGVVVYRDFTSYHLYGNPWEVSRFPWYVIWPMRLMSIVALQFVVAIGFSVFFVAVAAVWPSRIGTPVVKRIVIGAIAVLLELAAAAWFGRWFG